MTPLLSPFEVLLLKLLTATAPFLFILNVDIQFLNTHRGIHTDLAQTVIVHVRKLVLLFLLLLPQPLNDLQ